MNTKVNSKLKRMNFQGRVLLLAGKIPKGKVTTYKIIGRKLGRRGQVYRAVGRALKENKHTVKIPCHRVVCSDGSLGGYSRGIKKKIALLKKEGIEIKQRKSKIFVDLKKYSYFFKQ